MSIIIVSIVILALPIILALIETIITVVFLSSEGSGDYIDGGRR